MKKEEICVLIDTPEKAKEAYEILKNESILFDLKTRLLNGIISNDYPYIGYSYNKWNGFINILDSNEITLNELKELLNPKQTVILEIPLKYASAFEIALKYLIKAEQKHPIFPIMPHSQLSILTEEVGGIAKNINNGICHKSEVGDTILVCLRMLI